MHAAFPPPDPASIAPDSAAHDPAAWPPPTGSPVEGQPAPYSSLLYRPDPRIRWGLPTAALALLGIVLPLAMLILLLSTGLLPFSPPIVFAGALASYLVALVAPVAASRLRGLRSLAADFGLRFRWIDLPLGLALGLGVRVVIFAVLTAFSPFLGGAQGNLTLDPDPLWFVLSSVAIPVLVAPVVEEILCRGVVMRAVRNRMLRDATPPSHARRVAAVVVSILASTAVFALLHGHQMVNPATVITLGVTTVVAGLAHGWIATATGRLGAAIVSHATINASAVLLLGLVALAG
ncbi:MULTISPECIES: CPBP family intramembrane glutamic endopeptidase [unclassified Rathayibacter]|uniref:CPBP family intramembrane glutamic endopeptidase n=1 Tax=unclassified Rathayibacter TaxID=2609250 RepID=UPI00188CE99E|nr:MULTISPECIES: CPBP family intramembrane glutamic endopeptidase [unclassified Rathayibacter]MBF4463128.1 CPBP family intramembrane metalloprotease [Rathayibacter sp. VKM Ac-2879]MBF4504635.1 CPBP family intramembrane metalloprotease [Rathayibacter sp. VKM Ac-2878]